MSSAEQTNVTELPGREPTPVQVLLAEVLARLPAIPKNGVAPGNMGGYPFRKHEDVIDALKPLCAEAGLTYTPSTLERVETQRQTRSGGVMYQVDVHVLYTFRGPAGDQIEASTWGQGTDSGDKATQKAYTASLKSLLTIVFQISEGEGADAEAHDVPESAPGIRWAEAPEVDPLWDRAKALPESGKDLLRERWAATESLATYRPGGRIPADLVPLLASFVEAAEAEGRARPDAPETATGATENDGQAAEVGTPPETEPAAQEPSQEGADPAIVQRAMDEVEKMTDDEIREELARWSLPKSGSRVERRRRVTQARVRDALRVGK